MNRPQSWPRPRALPGVLSVGLLGACLFSACQGGPAARVKSVTLSGVSAPLHLGSRVKLSVLVKGTDGSVITGREVTYSSSDTNAVAVAPDGTLSALHLNATGVPVQVTATVGGVGGTLSVTTYGLDAAGGTYNVVRRGPGKGGAAGPVGSRVAPQFYLRFRGPLGQPVSARTTVTIAQTGTRTGTQAGTSGFGAPVTAVLNAGAETSVTRFIGRPAVSGQYTATVSTSTPGSSPGPGDSRTFPLDADRVLPAASAVRVTTDGARALLSGSLPDGAAGVAVIVNSADYTYYNYTDALAVPPTSRPWSGGALKKGSYGLEIDAYSARRDTGISTPDAFNVSAYTSPDPLTY